MQSIREGREAAGRGLKNAAKETERAYNGVRTRERPAKDAFYRPDAFYSPQDRWRL